MTILFKTHQCIQAGQKLPEHWVIKSTYKLWGAGNVCSKFTYMSFHNPILCKYLCSTLHLIVAACYGVGVSEILSIYRTHTHAAEEA